MLDDLSFSKEMAMSVIGVAKGWIPARQHVETLSLPGPALSSIYVPKLMAGVTIYPILYWRTRFVMNCAIRTGMVLTTATVIPGSQETPIDSTLIPVQERTSQAPGE